MKVQDGLYIGSCMAEMNKTALARTGITDVLQVAEGLVPSYPLNFNYMNIQVQDIPSEDMLQYFPKCFEFINRATSSGGKVLVHCAAGVSRSATVVLGYLMARHHMGFAAAMEHLKAVRPWVCPNFGFVKQLEAFQHVLHDPTKWTARHMVQGQQQYQQPRECQLERQQQQQHCLQLPQQQQQQQALQHTAWSSQGQQQQQQQPSGGAAMHTALCSGGLPTTAHEAAGNDRSLGSVAAPCLLHGSSSSSSCPISQGARTCVSDHEVHSPASGSSAAAMQCDGGSNDSRSGTVLLHLGPQLDPWAAGGRNHMHAQRE